MRLLGFLLLIFFSTGASAFDHFKCSSTLFTFQIQILREIDGREYQLKLREKAGFTLANPEETRLVIKDSSGEEVGKLYPLHLLFRKNPAYSFKDFQIRSHTDEIKWFRLDLVPRKGSARASLVCELDFEDL